MTIETHVADAIERVESEAERMERRLQALDRFESAVRDLEPIDAAAGGMAGPMTDGGVATAIGGSATSRDACATVREAFVETIHPTVEGSPSLGEALRDELGQEIALALAPRSAHEFTPPVKESVLSAAGKRRAQLSASRQSLALEAESLASAAEDVEAITSWLTEADETPLLAVGFDGLRARHEHLAEFREQCDELARTRQETLDRTVGQGGAAGVAHRDVVESLYEEFPTTYPVLTTVARLNRVCADAQRAVRDHLTRRV